MPNSTTCGRGSGVSARTARARWRRSCRNRGHRAAHHNDSLLPSHRMHRSFSRAALALALAAGCLTAPGVSAQHEGDYTIKAFHFADGESLPDLRIHYMTLGAPRRDAKGLVTNAVLILHGTTGSGRQFLSPVFAGVLYGPGQLLDTTRYFIILPDEIGHGKSSKP